MDPVAVYSWLATLRVTAHRSNLTASPQALADSVCARRYTAIR